MKKKILAILMATLTVGSLLSGCGGAQSGDATGKQENRKAVNRRAATAKNRQKLYLRI